MSIKLKKTLCFGLATLLVASVGASASNVEVSARHVRTHRVYRHHHKVNRKKIQRIRKRNVRHRRNKRIRYAKRNRKHARKRSRKGQRKIVNKKHRKRTSRRIDDKKYPINPDLLSDIKDTVGQSTEVTGIPKVYYGNFFLKNIDNIKNHDAFLHIAKHHSYALSNPETRWDFYAHELINGGQIYEPHYGYMFMFLNSTIPTDLKQIKGTNQIEATTENDGKNHKLIRLNSERQGIYMFQTQNYNDGGYDE